MNAPRKFVTRVLWEGNPWRYGLLQVMIAGRTQESKKAIREQQPETELVDEETTIHRELMGGLQQSGLPQETAGTKKERRRTTLNGEEVKINEKEQ